MTPEDTTCGWSQQEGVAYEIALDVLPQLTAAADQQIVRLRETTTPDHAQIATWEERGARWAQRRLDLTPEDTATVQQVLHIDSQILRDLQADR